MEAKSRPRIAIVVRPAAGGIRRHVTLLCSRLVENYDVILFAPADFTLDRPVPKITHIPLAIAAKTRPIHDWRTTYKLRQLLREHHCDWVHAHGLRAALIGVLAAKRAGLPAYFTAHNLVVHPSWLQKQIVKMLGAKADRVIAVSEAVKNSLVLCEIPPNKITVIPNGIDLAEIDATAQFEPLPFEGKIIAAMGRLSPEKGFDLLIRAFGSVAAVLSDARLILAGTGAQEQELKALAASLPSARRIHFLGYVEKTTSLYHAADVVAVPSREEGQGIVAIEAMAYRKPIVAFDVGGLGETLVSGQTGLLAKPENVEMLAEHLISLLRDDALCKRMGEAGRKRVEQEYTVEKMVERIEAVYKENK